MGAKPKEPDQPDRRAHPRNPVVVCEARHISGIEVFFGHATNLSRSGMFVATTKIRSHGSVYEIQFRLPGRDLPFRCRARVVWSRAYRQRDFLSPGFGLQFLDLPEDDGRWIDEWVATSERLS